MSRWGRHPTRLPAQQAVQPISIVKHAAPLMNEVSNPDVIATVSSFWQWITAAFIALPALGVFVSKHLTRLRAERRERIAIDASAAVVEGLRAECERLRNHNTVLVAYFEEAQVKIVAIARDNIRLQQTIEELHGKIAAMLILHGGK